MLKHFKVSYAPVYDLYVQRTYFINNHNLFKDLLLLFWKFWYSIRL